VSTGGGFGVGVKIIRESTDFQLCFCNASRVESNRQTNCRQTFTSLKFLLFFFFLDLPHALLLLWQQQKAARGRQQPCLQPALARGSGSRSCCASKPLQRTSLRFLQGAFSLWWNHAVRCINDARSYRGGDEDLL